MDCHGNFCHDNRARLYFHTGLPLPSSVRDSCKLEIKVKKEIQPQWKGQEMQGESSVTVLHALQGFRSSRCG